MTDYSIGFNQPWYLLLLLLAPLLWWVSFRSLSGLGPIRRLVALGLRSVILTLFVLALADIQLERSNDRLTVIYLLDQSQSIPPQRRSLMIDYVNRAIKEHRDAADQAGVVVFGADAAIEVPPFDDDVQMSETIESMLDPNYTNLAGAMKLAQASFPEDGARRVVIISDGNENLYKGEAIRLARDLVEKGIGIDVHPVKLPARGEVIVEKLAMPSDVRKGQPFDLTAVVTNTTEPAEGSPGTVGGRLIISQRAGDQPVVLSDERIELTPGKRVFTVRQQIDQPAFYEYEAQFVPDDPDDDATPQNNRATTFTHIRGSGQVLLIEDAENRGEHNFLAERLRKANLEVEIRTTDQLPSSLPDLQ
ncbi:MAG: VWA domain-containing protein, partial [Planctomycetes bacterium]|nr:VWA domain-containing protein [Planctomycetota bacterium]